MAQERPASSHAGLSLFYRQRTMITYKQKSKFCGNSPSNCRFESVAYRENDTFDNNGKDIHRIVFCQIGRVIISGSLFSATTLCAGEIMFILRTCEYRGKVLNDTILIIHSFVNTVCRIENCILSYLYTHRHHSSANGTEGYSPKLITCTPLIHFWEGIIVYLSGGNNNSALWKMKHKELIWLFTHHYTPGELRSFFSLITDEQISFRSLVLTHYHKVKYTEELADLCGYGRGTFRRVFKREFGQSVYRWLIGKKAEQILFRLSQPRISFTDIVDEFDFSSIQYFSRFCKQFIGDTPTNIRKRYTQRINNDDPVQK